jgi:DNA recombination protein RmuC
MPDFTAGLFALSIFAALMAGFLVRHLWSVSARRRAGALLHDMELRLASLKQENDWLRLEAEKSLARFESGIREAERKLDDERAAHVTLRETLAAGQARLAYFEKMNEETAALYQKFQTAFEELAAKVLRQSTENLGEHNRRTVSELVAPLKENMDAFERRMSQTFQAQTKDQIDLRAELKKLHDLNQNLGEEAGRLARAISGDSKKMGSWGEIVLEKVLESSGLEKDREYQVQHQIQDGEGNALRPDVLVLLPDHKTLIIDSKVSLAAYDRYLNTSDEDGMQSAIRAHTASVRAHILNLASKKYQLADEMRSPDFVLLFMPVEPALALAYREDPELFRFGWERQVVVVSPSTLLATLRTVAAVWKQEKQNRNAREIARLGARMYDKLAALADKLETLGNRIDLSRRAHDEAMQQLKGGRGNLMMQAEKMRRLGAPATKQISDLNPDDDEEDTA